MGDLRTILGSLLVSAVLAPFGAAAPGQFPAQEDPVRFFATCAGRLSAEMEFQWMFDGARADTIQSERASVLDILDAIMPPDQGRLCPGRGPTAVGGGGEGEGALEGLLPP